jgi:hypothetical protein
MDVVPGAAGGRRGEDYHEAKLAREEARSDPVTVLLRKVRRTLWATPV